MALARSPLAPPATPRLPAIDGVRLASRACGIKYRDRADVCLMAFDPGTAIAGVFTRSKTASAPVEWCRRALEGGRARAVVVNSGNANAFTGRLGEDATAAVAEAAAAALGCRPRQVFLASTGVIGEPLPHERIVKAMARLEAGLKPAGWAAAARAIMTTDTYPKAATRTAEIGGRKVVLNGIAKGSGMIAPDMATMLSFAATDAKLPRALLQRLLERAVQRSFNCITVDGDTSTSDTVLLAATGKAGHPRVPADCRPGDPMIRDFARALDDLMLDLAHQVARDGEGAQKFVAITVTGAASAAAARRIGLAIANSPLVKTAIAGEDANWGRIVMAVGKAGERAERDRLKIAIGGVELAREGRRVDGYDETPIARHMKGRDIDIAVDVGVGRGRATVWTCDLTHGYIDINADYRT
ncbi:MAG: bifunctional glutamate N-acetyltransferase/amino-acid acetyltransferase ArgJ [Kiloniellales bacterium]|nr:bifunctional glutamate N-acetyltransferase/amino-acid acetyltransferase ArgJ [Kiloniellales bacterium]